jgi:hypothetical protein
MNETLRDELILTYGVALCACLSFWRVWRRWLDGVSASLSARRGLVCAYWLLAFTVMGDLLASLKIQHDEVTPQQFRIFFLIAVGTMLQMALVALVLVPVVMRLAPGKNSLTKTLINMAKGAFISILTWAILIIAIMHEYSHLAK